MHAEWAEAAHSMRRHSECSDAEEVEEEEEGTKTTKSFVILNGWIALRTNSKLTAHTSSWHGTLSTNICKHEFSGFLAGFALCTYETQTLTYMDEIRCRSGCVCWIRQIRNYFDSEGTSFRWKRKSISAVCRLSAKVSTTELLFQCLIFRFSISPIFNSSPFFCPFPNLS